ncbi:MAG: 23S rRNA (adenine(2503)-C(2))-methyltransferase RlmN [Myxococcota bacterium]
MTAERRQLKDFSLERLREALTSDGLPRWRADQIAAWVYKRGVEDPAQMTDLDLALREQLAETWSFEALTVESVARSKDGTTKGLLRAADGAAIEAVVIPEEERNTLCVSTQVGCPLACSFCATGAMGFTRNLSTAEIIDQVCRMREVLPPGRELTNVVFMGMGEPLLNLSAVLEAVRLLVEPRAFGFAPRRVTVSTAGIVPKIGELLDGLPGPVNLAVSLHAVTDSLRDELVPINEKFPLEQLLGTLRSLPHLGPRRPIFFEYTLLAGVNDTPEDARGLVRLLRGLPYKLNLIPMNPHDDAPYGAPTREAVDAFMGVLSAARVTTTLRRSRGDDIDAACGQLAARPTRTPREVSEGGSSPAARTPKRPPGEPSALEDSADALRDR